MIGGSQQRVEADSGRNNAFALGQEENRELFATWKVFIIRSD